jgi:hypothetical protein
VTGLELVSHELLDFVGQRRQVHAGQYTRTRRWAFPGPRAAAP